MSNVEFTECTTTFLHFIKDLFVNSSEDISDFLVTKSNKIICKSDGSGTEVISNLREKWENSEIPSTLTIQNMKFIKIYDSSFHLIYRSIIGEKALIGTHFRIPTENIYVFTLIASTKTMQLQSTAQKDIVDSIIEMGQRMSGIKVIEPTSVQLKISLPETKLFLQTFISALKHMDFLCEYIDKGNSVVLKFTYKKEEKKLYPDEVYEQYVKK